MTNFIFVNRKKTHGAKSGEYGVWSDFLYDNSLNISVSELLCEQVWCSFTSTFLIIRRFDSRLMFAKKLSPKLHLHLRRGTICMDCNGRCEFSEASDLVHLTRKLRNCFCHLTTFDQAKHSSSNIFATICTFFVKLKN